MSLKSEELEDFSRNNVNPDGLARKYIYEKLRKTGATHKEALTKTIDSVSNLSSDSISEEQLEVLKKAIMTIPGQVK